MDRHLEELRELGFTVLEDAIAPALVDSLREALDEVEAREGIGFAASRFEGLRTVRIYNLLALGEVFWQVPLHEGALGTAERFLEDEELLLSSLSAITIGPGEVAQPLHEDTQQIPLPRPHRPLAMNAIWALRDFTEANGATRIVPGSHRRDSPPPYGGDLGETVPAEMRAGSIMLFDSQLWHAGGANRTEERRYAIACYYCVGWMRQQENQLLGVPQDMAARMPRRLQELLGYGVWKGQYGHVANHDPIETLGRERRQKMVWEDRRR